MKPIFTSLLLFLGFLGHAQSDFYKQHWGEVYKFEIKALPKSALSVVDTIYRKAKKDTNITQFTKALIYKSKFTFAISENAELQTVQHFKDEIEQSKPPQRNILESMLANLYWQYFQENRWKLYGRSRISEKVNKEDFRTWDAETIFNEISFHYTNSLRQPEEIQKFNLDNLNEILVQAEGSKLYRPTLYDLLAHNALDFYRTNESVLPTTNSIVRITDAKFFEEFHKVSIQSVDSLQPSIKAFSIIHSLLTFHRQRKDTSAYINLESDRLQLLNENSGLENKLGLYKNAMKKLIIKYEKHPSSTQVAFELASLILKENEEKSETNENKSTKRSALEVCNSAIAAFPLSDGAAKCEILRSRILRKDLEITSEKYLPINKPSYMLVKYTNVATLHFSLYRIGKGFEIHFRKALNDSTRLVELAKLKSVKTWISNLKNLEDHEEHTTEVMVPSLSEGTYILVAQTAGSNAKPILGYTFSQITDLAMIDGAFRKGYRYQIINRNSGAPIKDAGVSLELKQWGDKKETVKKVELITDKDGFCKLSNDYGNSWNVSATVISQKDTAQFGDFYVYQNYRNNEDEEDEDFSAKSFLFTDRSIYRPGQTVYFKGILIKTKKKKSAVVAGEFIEVFLEDVNSQEISKMRLKTNSYGSFSGEFKLPLNGLTGQYTLYADEDDESDSKFYDKVDDFDAQRLDISVEEYKRPTFEVSIKPLDHAFRVNDTVSVKGLALAYNGSKIINGKVSYHVKRTVRYPNWYYWYNTNRYSGEQEIELDETTTDGEGEFTVKFIAIPESKISPETLPIFYHEVTADVTDANGETRSATSTVKIGYHTMTATLNSPSTINKKSIRNKTSVVTENLNGQHIPAKGVIKIFKIKTPNVPLRKRPWEHPDLPLISEEEFNRDFPHDAYTNENESGHGEKGKLILSFEFDTEKSKEINWNLSNSWEEGSYLMELTSADPFGIAVTDKLKFQIIEPGDKRVIDNELLIFETDKASYQVGEMVKVKIGSASPDITITLDIESKNEIVKTFVEKISNRTKELTIPITESMNDGFSIHCTAVNFNSFLTEKKTVAVTEETNKLEIEVLSFKDKIQPGSKQTWSFEIKGDDAIKKEAEILASMYDASLDQFKPHEWRFDPIEKHPYYGYSQLNGSHSFGTQSFTVSNLVYVNSVLPKQYYDQLDWFGFSLTNNYYERQRYLQRLYSTGIDPNNPSKVSMLNSKHKKEGYIYGKITTNDGSPLPGVNIVIKGTTQGTVTDANGEYMLEADKNDELVFSFIGYSTAEAKVGKKNTINVEMEEDVKALSEVVVTGYGVTLNKKSLGYAVSILKSDTTKEEFYFTTNETLQGKVAGVQITGAAGGTARIMLRGASSVDGSSNPIYVVDGVVVESSKIDQSDLSEIQVLKGDAATAIYGSRGANGVIIITTKSGQKKLDEEMAKITARKNFNETAFFFPHINTDETGKLRFTFTTPESLTRWKLQLLAHTRDLATATKTLQTITQKELMVTPNLPRFLRVGDEIIFSTKVSNLTNQNKEGKIGLQLSDVITNQPVDLAFNNITKNKTFTIAAKGSTEVSWKLKIPTDVDAIQYRVVAKSGSQSDGEQNILPILSNRTLVTETVAMHVQEGQSKTFVLEKLKKNTSTSLKHHQLTLEVTSNPVWYAIQSLPYLIEFPYECAEQTFSRYYANAIASSVATSNPKIKAVFEQWAASDGLISNLEKNPELKSILIQETPWLRDAQSESEQRKRMALLFDSNGLKAQAKAAIDKLEEIQFADGAFPWFKGSNHASRYITQHIATGFGHLKQLKVVDKNSMPNKLLNDAIGFLDNEIIKDYASIKERANKIKLDIIPESEAKRAVTKYMNDKHIGYDQIQYLYMRSFFPENPINENLKPVVDYYQKQSSTYWQDFNLYAKGMVALTHHRNNNLELAKEIVQSVYENSILGEELGRYWKENQSGWYWYQSPIETQALLIEMFSEIEIAVDKNKTVDELRIWLLKNKQTSQWKSTKATSEAIYAILLNGFDWVSLDKQVQIAVGDKDLVSDTKQLEAGTGYFKTQWKSNEVNNSLSKVTITKKDKGIAWAGLYWQYFEDLDKITSAETPMKLSKKVFVVKRDSKGEILSEVRDNISLAVGDLLRIRIELSTDRPMEFLHMKDMRAAGLEPIDVLSEYKWQEGLGYYQSTKDAATHFFFEYMKPGVYVFEYDLRVNNKGHFSNGITSIENMYAPEFRSHSNGIRISVN
jgi:TonB-dependent SusC/RagA subfamily outer membrane receptor